LAIDNEDKAQFALSSSTYVIIHVLDVNDNHPQFTSNQYNFSVEENAETLTKVDELTVHDDDLNTTNSLRYTIIDGADGRFFIANEGDFGRKV